MGTGGGLSEGRIHTAAWSLRACDRSSRDLWKRRIPRPQLRGLRTTRNKLRLLYHMSSQPEIHCSFHRRLPPAHHLPNHRCGKRNLRCRTPAQGMSFGVPGDLVSVHCRRQRTHCLRGEFRDLLIFTSPSPKCHPSFSYNTKSAGRVFTTRTLPPGCTQCVGGNLW